MNGFSVIEPIIALALFCIIISGAMATAFQAQKLVTSSELRLTDLAAAQNLLEDAEQSLRQNWYSSMLTGVTAVEIDDYTKQLTAKSGEVELVSAMTDWKEAANASVCGPLKGNWQSPAVLSVIDTGPSNPATGAVAKNNLLYISTDSTTASKPDLFIYNIADPSSSTLLSSLNTGPGASSLALSGQYIFLGNQSINGQLEVIDVSDSAHPALVKTYKLPGAYSDNTTIANTLVYSRGKIYLGTAKSQIAEFHEIDVSAPLSPIEQGTFEINAGINSISTRGPIVFVASPASEELKILDASQPSAIKQIGGYDLPGGSGNGKSLLRLGDTLYLGRTLSGNELNILDVHDPTHPSLTSSKSVNTSINGLAGAKDLQFLITNDSSKKFQVWKNLNLLSSLNPSGTLTSISCQHNLIFVTTTSPDGVVIIGAGQ